MSIYKEMVEFQENNPIDFSFNISKIARKVKNSEKIFENTPFNANEVIVDGMKILYGLRAIYEKNLNGGGVTHAEATVYYIFNTENKLLMDRNTYQHALNIVQSEMSKKYS